MKSRIRSRSAATSGVGSKSISPSLLVARPPVRNVGATLPGRAPVAGEELAAFLQEPGELQLGDRRERAFEDRVAGADQFRRERQEELVGEARCLQLRVEARATLAEQRPHSALLA